MTQRLRIVNETRYETRAIRRLLHEALQRQIPHGDPWPWKNYLGDPIPLTVTIRKRRERVIKTFNRPHPEAPWVENTVRVQSRYGGRGSIGRPHQSIFVNYTRTAGEGGQERLEPDPDVAVDIVETFVHELYHNLGHQHTTMREKPFKEWAAWSKGIPIPFEAPKPVKPRPNVVDVRAERARANLTRWERRLKQAERMTHKWKRKVSYYEMKTRESTEAP